MFLTMLFTHCVCLAKPFLLDMAKVNVSSVPAKFPQRAGLLLNRPKSDTRLPVILQPPRLGRKVLSLFNNRR